MALRWVLRDEEVVSVLIGASKVEQILDNLKIINKSHITDKELAIIDNLSL